MIVVRWGPRHAVGIERAEERIPLADIDGVREVGAAESISQAQQPFPVVNGGGAGRCANAKDHRLGSIPSLDVQQTGGRHRHRFLPRDPHPTGIALSLGSGTLHGVLETVGRVDDLGGGGSLDADTPIRVFGVWRAHSVKIPSSTVATTPQWDTHIAQ